MGNTCLEDGNCLAETYNPKKHLIVATLNYGGILISPFEFYSNCESQEKELSQIFLSLIPLYITDFDPKKFQWDIGKIDHKIQQERYTPIYNPKVGIIQKRNELVGYKDFSKLWDQYFHKAIKSISVQPRPTASQINNMKVFDLVSYHTFLVYVYKISSNSRLENIDLTGLNIQLYKNFMQRYFSRSYLDEERKLKKIDQSLIKSKADVIFIQQPTQVLIKNLKKDPSFIVKDNGNQKCVIVVRKQSFSNLSEQLKITKLTFPEPQNKYFDLCGNKNLTVLAINGYILISVHLNSNKKKNIAQKEALKQLLNRLRKDFSQYQIIVGGDANSFISKQNLNDYRLFPKKQTYTTTRKKRTFIQPQFVKANQVIDQCKDLIITTLKINQKHIFTIDNKKVTGKQFIPTQRHPFDHFMVVCQLKRKI